MRLNFLGGILAVFIVAALIVAYSSFFTVFQTQQALLVRLGQPVRVVNEPGLNLKTRSSTRLSRREAAEFRAQGAQRAQEIRSRADREVTVLVAEATSKSEQIRGEGDATRNQIFADETFLALGTLVINSASKIADAIVMRLRRAAF
jgi:regulator of protease activity HflC (stomatin/prohibitin superfamily)